VYGAKINILSPPSLALQCFGPMWICCQVWFSCRIWLLLQCCPRFFLKSRVESTPTKNNNRFFLLER